MVVDIFNKPFDVHVPIPDTPAATPSKNMKARLGDTLLIGSNVPVFCESPATPPSNFGSVQTLTPASNSVASKMEDCTA